MNTEFHMYPMLAGKHLKQKKNKIYNSKDMHQGNSVNLHAITPFNILKTVSKNYFRPIVTVAVLALPCILQNAADSRLIATSGTLALDGGRSLAIMLSLNSLEYFMAIIDVSPCPYINTQIKK
ncbi:MAG: hypothetical protein L6271_06265, partial [Desulfobacteraceae bacterium]|nr:hypothetical protein [Pseudomonadota bacterium]MCG2743515.1 hypothetical protein [Desulfobacteraceae bacterium]